MSEELEAIQALYANYEDKAVMLSASSIAVLFYGLEAIKPLYRWQNGATDEITEADADEIQRIVDLAFYEVMGEFMPEIHEIGEIMVWPNAYPPDKFLFCAGTAISRTTYADLFAVIGTIYGSGDGSTTFNLPNLINKFPKMYNPSMGAASEDLMGGTGGANTVTLTTNQIPSHNHVERGQSTGASASRVLLQSGGGAVTDSALNTGSTGGGEAHENRPPFLSLNFIIYTGVPN